MERNRINLLKTNIPDHIETSQLICNAKQLTGFYMMGNIHRLWVKLNLSFHDRKMSDSFKIVQKLKKIVTQKTDTAQKNEVFH